jgi:hypothetical protein
VRGKSIGQRAWRFDPIAELRAGETITYDVFTTAAQPGTATLSAEVTSDQLRTPATDDETTQILSN